MTDEAMRGMDKDYAEVEAITNPRERAGEAFKLLQATMAMEKKVRVLMQKAVLVERRRNGTTLREISRELGCHPTIFSPSNMKGIGFDPGE